MLLSIESASGSAGALVLLIAKATLLLLAALGASALLQRASAGARHLVWVAIVGALLVLPFLAAWSPLRLEILPAGAPSVASAGPTDVAGTVVGAPATRGPAPNVSTPPVPAVPGDATTSRSFSPLRLAAMIWAVIAIAVSAWLAFGFFSVRRIVRRARLLDDREWKAPLYEIADRLGIDATPRLMRSDLVKMPFACGLITPSIILPAESDGWDIDRRRAVLMHELAHIRRRDLVGHTLGRLACAVYWFHPLVWTAVRRLRIESERACDDLALTCGLRATTYAEHLLDIVSNVGKTRTPAIAIPMAHRREFEGRMLAILDPDVRRRVGGWQSTALIGALVGVVLIVGAAAPAQRAATPPSTLAVDSSSTRELAGDTGTREQVSIKDEKATPGSASRSPASRQQERSAPDTVVAESEREMVTQDFRNDMLQALVQGRTQARDDRPALLITVLRSDTSAHLRRVAAWGLSRYADRAEVGTALATALQRDASPAVRGMSAWALASGEDRADVIEALSEALRGDADMDVREMAAWTLGNLGASSAVEALTAALADQSSPKLRRVALWALGNAEPTRAPQGAVTVLSDSDKGLRLLAAWTLFRIGDPETVGALEQALSRETERELRMAYIRALGAIGEQSASALARLIDSPDPEVRAVVVEALAGKGSGPWPWPWPRPRPSP